MAWSAPSHDAAAPRPFRVKVAAEEWEFRAIHRLNHATFVDEIPQHEPQPSGLLVDSFHHENTYLVALEGEHLVGMLAIRGTRPFSLDRKLPDLDSYLPDGHRFCEVRLLAIPRHRRSGRILQHLLAALWRYSLEHGFDAAVISGTTGQLKLYRRLGFVPFGPLVGLAGAQFQPMFVTRAGAAQRFESLTREKAPRAAKAPVNLLPGPVDVEPRVRRAVDASPQSHRGSDFKADLAATRRLLCNLTGAAHAEIMVGSGTLANDAVAAQLPVNEPGLILTNGEFGERLTDHARRLGLVCDVLSAPWGSPLDLHAVQQRLSEMPAGWLWMAHLETSTGVLNDLATIADMCHNRGIRLCVDAVSSTGLVPVDLRRAWFGTAVSGKGLGSFPGLAIVFHNHPIDVTPGVPRYLDLGLYARNEGIPFTHSSNLVRALRTAVEGVAWEERYCELRDASIRLRSGLRNHGFQIVSPEAQSAPGVVTIALPSTISSTQLERDLADDGYLLAAASEYLRCRNWIQISLMSRPSRVQLDGVVEALCRQCAVQTGR